MLKNAFIPRGAYWSSPFAKWQGSLSSFHSMKLAAQVGTSFLEDQAGLRERVDGVTLGMTVPQRRSFYGAPWLAGMLGLEGVTGPTVNQACATSARLAAMAALEVEAGARSCILNVACDRTSNGAHLYYPDPTGPGGRGEAEDWVWDNFNKDPHAGGAMLSTAENVAREAGISREEQDEMTLLRSEQYQRSLADDRAFQRRYMRSVEVGSRRKPRTLDGDEGIFPTTAEGLAKLRPVAEDGTVTFGSQTHPADGNAGLVVTTESIANELSPDGPRVQILSFGEARVGKGMMPMAVVPAARAALTRADISVGDCKTVNSHNPFAVNDVYFCREMGIDAKVMNQYGSPLVYGHPQGPTGLRAIIELIENLVEAGGGHGLFTGCAAGDSAMAVVVKVG